MSDPSLMVAEAFKQFSQTTVSALRAYEQGTRARLNQAEDDLRALRHERDDALRELYACKEQTRARVADVDRCKAEMDKVLVVNQHQAELVAQLRQEAQQWKEQCLRLEETLRGEIKAWKDQFLRLDTERTRLLNQLSAPSSQTMLPSHTSKRLGSASASSSHKRPPYSPTKAPPLLPRVVRRVQAVVEVPVKEEEEEYDEGMPALPGNDEHPDPALPQPTSAPTAAAVAVAAASAASARRGAVKRRSSNASASSHQRSSVRPSDDRDKESESYVDDDDEEPPSDREEGEAEADGGEYVDEEEVENAIANGTPTATGRKALALPWGQKHLRRHEPDEDDDELMIYAKDDPHRVRPPHENHGSQLPRRKSVTDVPAQRRSATNTSAQKRKTTETGPGGVVRTKRRR